LLNIDSAFTRVSLAGRDDADGFFFAIVVFLAINVYDQQHRTLHDSKSVPPLFARHDAILTEDCPGIIENECRGPKRDPTVLPLVKPVLLAVPFELHSLYKMYNARSEMSTALRRCDAGPDQAVSGRSLTLLVERFLMQGQGLKQRDLIPQFGSESAVSMFLAGQRKLTLDQVRKLYSRFKLPADVFLETD